MGGSYLGPVGGIIPEDIDSKKAVKLIVMVDAVEPKNALKY